MYKKDQNKRQQKASPIGIAFVVLAIAATLMENVSGGRRVLVLAVAAIFAIVIIAGIIFFIKKAIASSQEVKNPFDHSHDRIRGGAAAADCDVDEHWKVQLDGFLKAGIIDRKEYAVLMQKHGKAYGAK